MTERVSRIHLAPEQSELPGTGSSEAASLPKRPRFIVAQLGARMHYAVPRYLSAAGCLERLFTDAIGPTWLSSDPWRKLVSRVPLASLRRFAGRQITGIRRENIVTFPGFALLYWLDKTFLMDAANPSRTYLRINARFCRLVTRRSFGKANAVYAYNSSALELFAFARQRGMLTVLEQTIAPREIEESWLREERRLWPQWTDVQKDDPAVALFAQRERSEWQLADSIICGSKFVHDGIHKAGGPADRCHVVPYGVDPPTWPLQQRRSAAGRLNILFCGAVGLRKGAPYLYEVASKMPSSRFRFRCVGTLEIPARALRQLRSCVDVIGPVPRSEIAQHFAWADVFLFPSVCEGSATVCYEALGWGLPVITTPNAGSIVRDGVDGFVIAPRDTDAMRQRLETLLTNSTLLSTLSRNARERAEEFTVQKYGERLLGALTERPRSGALAT